MKKNIEPAQGKLGILIVGVGGAVSTTLISGVLSVRKGLSQPVGSITQMATIKMQNGKEMPIKDIVPIADLKDIVFVRWLGHLPGKRLSGSRICRGAESQRP